MMLLAPQLAQSSASSLLRTFSHRDRFLKVETNFVAEFPLNELLLDERSESQNELVQPTHKAPNRQSRIRNYS